eukprot:4789949-Pleurochrysis_carterae.AAC.2
MPTVRHFLRAHRWPPSFFAYLNVPLQLPLEPGRPREKPNGIRPKPSSDYEEGKGTITLRKKVACCAERAFKSTNFPKCHRRNCIKEDAIYHLQQVPFVADKYKVAGDQPRQLLAIPRRASIARWPSSRHETLLA